MLYESHYPRLPEPFCKPTCPRQQTRISRDCDCGGADKEWQRWKDLVPKQED